MESYPHENDSFIS